MRADKAKVPHTLLLADDSVTIQRVIELTFADEDVRVVAVSDGEEAIAVLDKTPPDIVLADVGMPGQNGYEVARHIRDTPRLSHIPIVLLTGAFEPVDQAKVAEVGCDGVLAKPFEPQLVIARVKELLAKPRGTEWAHDAEPAKHVEADEEIAEFVKAARSEADSWVTGPVEGPPTDTASYAEAVADIDNYFDRLDDALTKQQKPSRPDAQEWPAEVPRPSSRFEGAAAGDEESRLPTALSRAPEPEEEISPASSPVRSRISVPPLAEAFAALLAAEQSGPSPSASPMWPVTTATQAPPAAAVPDDVVEQVTRRVIDQLSDRVVREVVVEIVTSTAERLVKEELERIKRHLGP